MRLVFDPTYDMGWVDFSGRRDLHHTESPFGIDQLGNVVCMNLDNLSQGIDLTNPRIPAQYVDELARRLRRKGYRVRAPQPEAAAAR